MIFFPSLGYYKRKYQNYNRKFKEQKKKKKINKNYEVRKY